MYTSSLRRANGKLDPDRARLALENPRGDKLEFPEFNEEAALGSSVSFSGPIHCAVTPPGVTTTADTQSETLSAPANVTAAISADTSGGTLTVLSVTSYILKTEIVTPDPGELPPGAKIVPVKIQVPVEVATSNGVTPLAVASGQYVVVTVQFAPAASTPDTCTAQLQISGDTWNPVSVSITATVGEVTAKVLSVFVDQGKSATVDVTVSLVAGAATTAKLLIDADASSAAPNVTVALTPSSLSLSPPFHKYDHAFRGNRSLTVAAPIRAARVSKRLSDTLANF